jgi:recombination protein U
MTRQLHLANIEAPTAAANRGRHFQRILNNTHTWYARQRWGKVYEIPNAFAYVSERRWQLSAVDLRARTLKGAPLLRVKSAPDYMGGIAGRHVVFDAKEFAAASIPLGNFTEHQIDDLYLAERAGSIAGFMVWEKRTERVYWLPASYVRAWSDSVTCRRAGVAKSLNFAKCADKQVRLLCSVERDGVAHYAPVLVSEFGSLRAVS